VARTPVAAVAAAVVLEGSQAVLGAGEAVGRGDGGGARTRVWTIMSARGIRAGACSIRNTVTSVHDAESAFRVGGKGSGEGGVGSVCMVARGGADGWGVED